jgi:hypothetical protein
MRHPRPRHRILAATPYRPSLRRSRRHQRHEGSVQDRVGEQPDPDHRRIEIVGGGGKQVDGLADVTPRGGDADLETSGQAGHGAAVTEVGRHEQGLPAWVETPPAGSALVAVGSDEAGEVVQAAGGQRNRGRVRQHGEAPGWGI